MITQAEQLAAYITGSDMIYIDTCSLRHPGMPKFYDHVKHILERQGKKLVCPQKVWEEVKKYMGGNAVEDEECRRAKKYLQKLFIRGVLDLKPAEEYESSHADHGIKADFNKYYMTKRMFLITNDYELAANVLDINNDASVHSRYKIHAAFISDDGYLIPHSSLRGPARPPRGERGGSSSRTPHEPRGGFTRSLRTYRDVPQQEMFPLGSVPRTDEPLSPILLPQAGSTVYTDRGGVLHLTEEISRGGEGSIYATDAVGCVAKIFQKKYCSRNRRDKLLLMLSKPISYDGICWPLNILNNDRGEFVGYLMPRARGDSLRKVLMKRWLVANQWERKELIGLCISVLDKLAYLQERNVITVDYNLNNILVEPNGDTWLVDVDSCQVGDYPAAVDTRDFTPPEIYRRRDVGEHNILFSRENVNFSTAVLLFKILVPGQHPMHDVQEEAGTVKDDILGGTFPYRLGDEKRGKPPKGVWQKCWSHLHYKVKRTFWHTFQQDGELYAPNARYDARSWQGLLEVYQDDIDKMAEWDDNSLAAFPTSFKKAKGVEYGRCHSCNREEPQEWLMQKGGFCHDCAKDIAEEYTCERCGADIIMTNLEKYKNGKHHKYCHDCYDQCQQVYTRDICRGCGHSFEITVGEKEYCTQRNWSLPKRCPECRERKRESNDSAHDEQIPFFDAIKGLFS